MQRLVNSTILVIGTRGLGIEIAKNVVLAGVKALVIYDPYEIQIEDLGSHFFATENDVGKKRDFVSVNGLKALNPYVQLSILDDLNEKNLSLFQTVVCTDTISWNERLRISEYCHLNNINFISTEISGFFGYCFNDFGPNFIVEDTNGEQLKQGMIASITNDKEAIVTCLDETRHGLEDGDLVTFKEVVGMNINNLDPIKIKVLGPFTFSIADTTNLGSYQSGGLFLQVKEKKSLQFKQLKDCLQNPEFIMSDFAKFDRPLQIHLAFITRHEFNEKYKRYPQNYNEEDLNQFIQLTKEIKDKYKIDCELDMDLSTEFCNGNQGYLSPMAAVIGGLVAQEVLKSISGKFMPIKQYFYFDSLESKPVNTPPTAMNTKPLNCRYDSMINFLGSDFCKKLSHLNLFLVGAGAIGCEMVKNLALLGCTNKLIITDMDTIEKSNLNRQFLFRPSDVGNFKSKAAALKAKEINPKLNIISLQDRVGKDTEHVFDDQFWNGLDLVINALDNLEARQYVDRRCVLYCKPLLESGTLGTKGNTQVVIPYLTESYSSSQDPPEKSIPICTLKNFPNQIEHTIQWARELFESNFTIVPTLINDFHNNKDEFIKNLEQNSNDILLLMKSFLLEFKPSNFEECIRWAKYKYFELFVDNIKQLLYNFPPDCKTSSGALFWSGPKRLPTPATFDASNQYCLDFVVAASNLYAQCFNIPNSSTDTNYIKSILDKIDVPDFKPKEGVKIQDDDTNFHMAFITAASNLRALNYNIEPSDIYHTKLIAGKIIPAIATTTSLVTGLVCLELLKLVDDLDNVNKMGTMDKEASMDDGEVSVKVDRYKNAFVNLALPFFAFSEPIEAPKLKFIFKQDITIKDLVSFFNDQHQLDISMISSGVIMIYNSFIPSKKMKDRIDKKISVVYEEITLQPIPNHVNFLLVDVCASDKDDNDVEVPSIQIFVR